MRTCVVASGIDASWSFLGVGDLDGDGIPDVLWRLPDGSVNAHLMRGCGTPPTVSLGATAQASWAFAGIGVVEFQAHTSAGVFWRDANGNVIQWRLHNGTSIFSTTLAVGTFAGWQIAAIADFNGDGVSDIF